MKLEDYYFWVTTVEVGIIFKAAETILKICLSLKSNHNNKVKLVSIFDTYWSIISNNPLACCFIHLFNSLIIILFYIPVYGSFPFD